METSSLPAFQTEYETNVTEVTVRGRGFHLFTPKWIEGFIDPKDVFHDFPLWCKIWEASLVLADDLAGTSPCRGKRFLELGGGLGLVSIVAASFGHDITMTEYNPHAVKFARANAHVNQCPDLKIMNLDWNRPSLEGLFDCIVGSEVIYHERDFEALLKLFKTFLKPEGEILLAAGIRQTSMAFFGQVQQCFHLKAQKKVLRSKGREVPVILCRMVPILGSA
jgi:2-polyprenyl-3-methyl-5-hydroxy-6-metoxy-1,4-benzoquinol methylase